MTTALVREVGDSYGRALAEPGAPDVDLSHARTQHDRYRTELANAGYRVEALAADEDCPDGVFIEDAAVVLGDTAIIARPGAASRRAEVGPVAEALSVRFSLVEIIAPGTLDGGDVFIAGNTIYAGLSGRTNQAGLDQLFGFASEAGMDTVAITVGDTLHLKSAVLPLDEETVLVTVGGAEEEPLRNLRIIYEDPRERYAASVLPLGDGRLLVTSAAPRTSDVLSDLGYEVVPIDISEFQAKSGGLTCLSILF